MPNVLVNKAHELKDGTRAAVEAELGRELADDEDVTIMAFSPHAAPRGKARQAAVRGLKGHFRKVDRRTRKTSAQETEAAIKEALRTIRPGYRERE
ncbi:MAG TPA: hypothetical protein VKG84_03245 [Candidatus Acidoferrales bacterium]|nr:hypothetical protein [Candidatus Acidoferrales bacterium]